ncbi:hypothetical protein M3Y96_00156600 [Aphelenchoides besseyi]|nr:hypothetical protein M3Y96_00156600 [Aphelenchoides besseyi]
MPISLSVPKVKTLTIFVVGYGLRMIMVTYMYMEIKVHKCVLTTKSNFFADQFHSDTTGTEHVVEGTTTDAINAMVEFVYLGTANKLREHVTELYKLAEKSLELLEQPTSMETAAEYFIFALENKDRALICIAINYAERNGGKTRFFLTNVFLALIDKNLELYKTAMETLRNYI